MVELVVIGFVAGIVAGISPCILPVLPVVLATGATTPEAQGTAWSTRARPVAVVAGLIVSFSLLILTGSEVISLLHLPQDLLRDTGIALLVLVGLGPLYPPLATVLERPFARIGLRQPSGKTGGFVIGLGLGVLFVPCAGPVLAAITVVGATHRVGFRAVILTVAFAAGAAVPLLAVAVAGSSLTQRVRALREHGTRVRQVSGVVLIVMALTIGLNVFSSLQHDIPGYTSALQKSVEGSSSVRKQLNALAGNGQASLASCSSQATSLVNCGPAPDFTGITAWLNTPGGAPLSLASLQGKVVLVDFWTYSCINCQRTLPDVEAWSKQYADDGLVVVGVHTPEFAFEHVVSNVRSQAGDLGVRYPVAIDNNYDTWNAYGNEYWPADYLIDATGAVRHVHFGEGDYATTEGLIRQLLTDAHPTGIALPPPSTWSTRPPPARSVRRPTSATGTSNTCCPATMSSTTGRRTTGSPPPSPSAASDCQGPGRTILRRRPPEEGPAWSSGSKPTTSTSSSGARAPSMSPSTVPIPKPLMSAGSQSCTPCTRARRSSRASCCFVPRLASRSTTSRSADGLSSPQRWLTAGCRAPSPTRRSKTPET